MTESGPQKDREYYQRLRPRIANAVPEGARRVLDVGCAEGELGRFLREHRRVSYVAGIEVDPQAAARAREALHHVVACDLNATGSGEVLAGLPKQGFDCIVFADVLEHLIDPWRWLRDLAGLLVPGGTVIVSLPNLRYYRVVLALLFRGRFEYQDEGILDWTHLRFFTEQTARGLLEQAGLEVVAVKPLWWKGGKARFLSALSLSLLRGVLCPQWLLIGSKPRQDVG